jgi:hypothetical protein
MQSNSSSGSILNFWDTVIDLAARISPQEKVKKRIRVMKVMISKISFNIYAFVFYQQNKEIIS